MILLALAQVATHKTEHYVTLSPHALMQLEWLMTAVIAWWLFGCWVAYKEQRLVLWLCISVLGYPVSLVLVVIATPLGIVATVAWYACVVLLPLWWLGRMLFGRRVEVEVVDTYADLKPLVDERGKPR